MLSRYTGERRQRALKLDLGPQPLALAYDADGNVRVAGTRVTLDTVMACFKQDLLPEEIAYNFPTVGLANIYATIAYYLTHQAEVDAYLEQQDQKAEALRQRIEALQGTEGWFERLLEQEAESERAR
jgi:uncharacterized protein (DUF433 family)